MITLLLFTALAEESYGAIATGPGQHAGWAANQTTFDAAKRLALQHCNHSACVVDVWWRGPRCASVARGAAGYTAHAWGSARSDVERWAIDGCGREDRQCRSLLTACNEQASGAGGRWLSAGGGGQPFPGPTPAPPANPPPIPEPVRPAPIPITPEIIRACERAFDGDTNERECLALAAKAQGPILGALQACERAFDGDTNELKCLAVAIRSPHDPTEIIQTCERAQDGDTNELACITTSLGL